MLDDKSQQILKVEKQFWTLLKMRF
jgi:hypothetical protein